MDRKSAARSATLQSSFLLTFVTALPPTATRFNGLYGQHGLITRPNFGAGYNKQRDAARSQDVDEPAAAARTGVRLLRRRGQPGAHHPSGAKLPDPHTAADPDAR